MAEQRQPHAVVVPYPGQGHINPLMQLSLRLAMDHGFYVTFACTRANLDRIRDSWTKSGLAPPLERGFSIHLRPVRDDVLPPRSMSLIFEFLLGCQNLKQPLLELIDELHEDDSVPPVSCIVSDSMLCFVQGVAESLGVPWIAYYPFPASSLLVHLNEAEGKLAETDLGLDLRKDELFVFSQREGGHQFMVEHCNCLRQAEWVILNTSDELESAELEVIRQRGLNRVLPVGPLQPVEFIYNLDQQVSSSRFSTAAMWYEEEDLVLSWLASRNKSSVLYISFGSIASVSLKDMEKLLEALMVSKQWFLWVFRNDTVDGAMELKQRFVDRAEQTGHGVRVSWAPQLKVLRHPATAAFLSHCGWNSTFEAIVAGVPVVAWPCFADQKVNAKYVVDVWRTGVKISDMVDVVNDVMTGELGRELRCRAAALSQKCSTNSCMESMKKIFERAD